MDFLVQDANLMYQDFLNFPNEVLFLFASLFMEIVIILAFVQYFTLWLWDLPLHLA